MKHMVTWIAGAIVLASPMLPAAADTPAGRWAFETDQVNLNCVLKGEMQIWPTNTENKYTCRFIANQLCEGDTPLDIKVAQTCTATLSGDQVNIESAIDRTVSVSPKEMRARVDQLYAPDHFFVSLNASGDEMIGMFHSVSQAFVRFTRLQDLTS